MSIKGIALIRVSTAGQAHEDRAGIPAQRESVRRIALQYNIDLVRTFELTDLSGAKVFTSTEYREFLSALEHPEIRAVVTKEFSRLMRPERFEDYGILQHFQDNNIVLYMPDVVMDLSNRNSRFMGVVRAGVAGLERLEIRQRIMDGKEALRRQGKHPSANHTLARGIGYDKKNGWFYDEEKLAAVRLLFSEFLGGNRNYEELSRLTGIPRSSVRVILCNPVYSGTMTYRTKNDLSPSGLYPLKPGKTRQRRRKMLREDDEVIRVATSLEPVINADQHRFILDYVEGKRSVIAQVKGKHGDQFLYRGFLRCGSCRQPVYTHSNSSKQFYYCRTRNVRDRAKLLARGVVCDGRYMSKGKLNDIVDGSIAERLSDAKFLSLVIGDHLRNTETPDTADVIVGAQIEELDRKRKRIQDAYFDGAISASDWRARLDKVQSQMETLRAIKPASRPTFDPSQVLDVVQVFSDWKFLEMSQKRTLLGRVLPEVFVYNYRVIGATLLWTPGCDTGNRLKTAVNVTTPPIALPVREIFIPFESRKEVLCP